MSWLSHAAQETGKEIDKAANAVADAASDAGHAVVTTAEDAYKAVRKLYEGVIEMIMDATVGVRTLRMHERNLAWNVYKNSLPPLDNVLIVSLSGIEGRAFTLPTSMLAAVATDLFGPNPLVLLALSGLAAKGIEQYLVFLGKEGFKDAMGNVRYSTKPGDVFIHELGHVWQGYHSAFTWWYVFNSIYYQATCGASAYDFTEGRQWSSYGAEQQASIIQHWFVDDQPDFGQLYSYMKCNVWPGKPFATTYF
jgi:hypothetical protein